MAALDFDPSKVVANVIPKGDQRLVISSVELKPTAKPGGQGLNLKFTVVGGQYANRSFFQWINIKNANPQAQAIGEQELKEICNAIGVTRLTDTSQLLNGSGGQISKPFLALVDIRDGDMGKVNVAKKYRRLESSIATTQPSQPAPPSPPTEQVATPATDAAPPWAA